MDADWDSQLVSLGQNLADLRCGEVAEGFHSREHVDLDRSNAGVHQVGEFLAPLLAGDRVARNSSPEHVVNMCFWADDLELVFEGLGGDDRRQGGAWHVDDAGDAACSGS